MFPRWQVARNANANSLLQPSILVMLLGLRNTCSANLIGMSARESPRKSCRKRELKYAMLVSYCICRWNGKEEVGMLKAVKNSIHRMTSHLQLISSYLEMEDYAKALGRTKETIKEMHALEATLTGMANVGMTVPKDGAVVVPHGSRVVSHEDVNVDIDSDEVRAVEKNEVRVGHGNDNPKTK